MISAAQQKMTYYYCKGYQSRAKNSFKDIQTYFFKIRRAFDDRVWHRGRNSLNHAKRDANKILKNMKGSAQESIVQAIFNKLKVKYPWYTWAVAAVKNDRPRIRGLEFRGSTYFRLENRSDPKKIKAYFVVHEDTTSSANCIDITQATTLLVFKKCGGCNSDYIYAADNILSKKRCGSSTLERVADIKQECSTCCHCTSCAKRVKAKVRSWAFIASALNTITTNVRRTAAVVTVSVGKYHLRNVSARRTTTENRVKNA